LEQNGCLGIYVKPDGATVVLAAKAGGKIEIIEQFCITAAEKQQQQQSFSFAQIAKDITAACEEKQLAFTDIAVAVDCRLYRQQILHSEFTEQRQIAQTIKFDAEEALAVNAAETAVAFEIAAKGLSGSEVTTFAVSAGVISEIILALQNSKLDPVTVEPDSICLRRMVQQMPAWNEDPKPMWMAISQNKCFIIAPPLQYGNASVRAFLTGTGLSRNAMLAREIIFTTASTTTARRVQKIRIFDSQVKTDFAALGEQTALAVEAFDPAQIILTKPEKQADCDSLDVIIAAGAAAGLLIKSEKVDFRPDFMPYQGKKAILEKTIKILSVSLAVLFITLGIFLHLQYYRTNNYRNRLQDKFSTEYAIAMTGAKFTKGSEAVRKLKSEINRIKDVKSGLLSTAGEDSVEAKLAFLFEAINSVPKDVDIEIEKIAVTTKTMNITGSTSSRGYLQLFGAVDKHPKLARGQSSYESKDNRDYFRLTVELK
jgi:hypothetical protein